MKPSKLSVAVQVDLDGRHVTIRVTAGALTALSQQGLHAVIRRARTLTPGVHVAVDLSTLSEVEASAVRLLHEALEDPGRTGRGGAVRLVLPEAACQIPATVGADAVGDPADGLGRALVLGVGAGREVAA
ncbi:hypothetical protein [Kocuria sp. KH4]